MGDNNTSASGARALYDLLDTLVALRIKFGTGADEDELMAVLVPAKMREVRTMLDAAISSTKQIISDQERPPPV